jgi:hypothetical protein
MEEHDHFRGYPIEKKNGEFIFCDTGKPTIETWQDRPCGFCGKYNTPEGHDGCIGTIPGVTNACCGHGDVNDAYVQFETGKVINGQKALPLLDTFSLLNKSKK